MKDQITVVGIDYPCLDYIVGTDRLPPTNGEADIDCESWQGGGMVPTALVALGRLGVRSGLMGISGDDIYGRYCAADLERHNVDTSRVLVDPGSTTDFCICVAERSTQGRSFITRWGNRRKLTPADLDADYIVGAKVLHLCGVMDEVNVAAAKIAKAAGVTVAIDADRYSPLTEEHLDLIDVLIANQNFYETRYTDGTPEENCKSILARGTKVAVFTMGEKGGFGCGAEGFFAWNAHKITNLVDTTGAGDVFHGAFLYAMLQNKSWKDCAKFASAVSAIKCCRLGGRAGIPTVEITEHFMKTGQILPGDFDQREAYYRNGLSAVLEETPCP